MKNECRQCDGYGYIEDKIKLDNKTIIERIKSKIIMEPEK